jgi:hypothetical protein
MKKISLFSLTILGLLAFAGCASSSKMAYIKGSTLSIPYIEDTLAVDRKEPNSVIRKISFIPLSDGYNVVTVSGRGCVHNDGAYVMLSLSKDGKDAVDYSNIYTIWGYGRGCGIGEKTHYTLRYVEPVVEGEVYTYYLLGNKGLTKSSKSKISGNIAIGDMTVVFYP